MGKSNKPSNRNNPNNPNNPNKSAKNRKKKPLSHLETIREKYGEDYGVKHDIQIEKYLRKNGYNALAELLENGKKKNKNTST